MKNGMREIGKRAGIIIIALASVLFTGKLNAQGYDSTYVLSIKQKFAIPEDVANSDQLGYWQKTCTWRSGNAISYSIKSNFNAAFSINSASGLLSISDATKIKGKIVRQDTVINLIIRTTDSGIGYEDDTCVIQVKEIKYCKFIDYTYTGTKTGTRSQPFNDLSNLTITSGYGYFIKRGNTPKNKVYSVSGIVASLQHPTIIAAYGSGNNPEFSGSGLSSSNGLFYFLGTPTPSSYCYIYNITMKDYPSGAIRVASRSSHFSVYNVLFKNNCRITNADGLSDLYFYGSAADTLINWGHELINLESVGSWCPLLKTDASGVCAYNIKAATANAPSSVSFNFRFSISYFSKLSHFWFVGGSRSLQVRYPNITVTDGVITGSTEGGMFLISDATYNGKLRNLRINNVLFKNNDNGIYGYSSKTDNTQITNCSFVSNKMDGMFFLNGGDNRVIKNCSFINNGNDGLELIKSQQASTNLSIEYCQFYGNKGKAINASAASCASNLKIYNNTIIGTVDLSGSTNEVVRNNFYESLSSATTSSNNIVLTTISQSSYFKSPSTKNYQLLGTAVNAIDKGYNLGLKYDIINSSISGVPDIGAYEYKTVAMTSANTPPDISNQTIVIAEETPSNNIIVATDVDPEQQLSFDIISGNESGNFQINTETGELAVTSNDVFTPDTTTVQLVVAVTDNGSSPESTTANIDVVIVGKDLGTISSAPTIENKNSGSALNIYPNPSKGNINVEIDFNNVESKELSSNYNSKKSEIGIFDVSGKMVYSRNIDPNESSLQENMDLSNVPNGLYFVRLTKGNTVLSDKLIINK